MSQSPKSYRELPALKFRPLRLTDREYGRAIQTFVFVCADAIVINRIEKKLFLAKRRAKPWPHWWVIGGRIRAGENESIAIQKNFARETSLTLPERRFTFRSMIRMLWKNRAQAPHNIPCDTMSYWFTVELTPRERGTVETNLDPKEYDSKLGLQPFDLKRLRSEKVHPALIDLYREIFPI